MPKSRKPEKWFGCFSTISFIANLRCSTKDAKLLMVGLNNYIPIYSERLVSISKVPKFLYIYICFCMDQWRCPKFSKIGVDLTYPFIAKTFHDKPTSWGTMAPFPCLAEITEAEGCLGFIASRKSVKFPCEKTVGCFSGGSMEWFRWENLKTKMSHWFVEMFPSQTPFW